MSTRVRRGVAAANHDTREGHEIAQSSGGHDQRTESALLLLKRLTAALNTCHLYGAGHARTGSAVAGLAAVASRGVRPPNGGALTVEVTPTAWRLSSDRAEHAAEHVAPLLQALHGRGVRTLSFGPGVTDADLRALLAVLDLPIERVRAAGGLAEALRARDVRGIAIREVAIPVRRALIRGVGAATETGTEAGPSATGPASAAPRAAERLIKQFVAAAKNVRLYGESHPTVQAAIDELFRTLRGALAAADILGYEVRSGTVYAGNAPLEDDAMTAATFASDCAARRIERLTFARGLTRAELALAVALFAREPEALIVEGGFTEALRARRVAHVR